MRSISKQGHLDIASLLFKGWVIEQTTVKWSLFSLCYVRPSLTYIFIYFSVFLFSLCDIRRSGISH